MKLRQVLFALLYFCGDSLFLSSVQSCSSKHGGGWTQIYNHENGKASFAHLDNLDASHHPTLREKIQKVLKEHYSHGYGHGDFGHGGGDIGWKAPNEISGHHGHHGDHEYDGPHGHGDGEEFGQGEYSNVVSHVSNNKGWPLGAQNSRVPMAVRPATPDDFRWKNGRDQVGIFGDD